jgi:hypothetical protein
VHLTGQQNRHADEDAPTWTLRIEGTMHPGIRFTLEYDGPSLSQITLDAGRSLLRLGFDNAFLVQIMRELGASEE